MARIDTIERQVKKRLKHERNDVLVVWRDDSGKYTYSGASAFYDTLGDALATIPAGLRVIYDDMDQ